MTEQTNYHKKLQSEFLVEFGESGQDWTVDATDLLEAPTLEDFLSRYESFMECPDRQTAASRWSYHLKDTLLYVPLYALARWDLVVDVSLEDITFAHFPEAEYAGHRWGMVLPEDVRMETDTNRQALRQTVARTMLEENFQPIVENLSRIGNVSTRLLWQNLAHVLYLRYPAWVEATDDPAVKQRFREDYEWLTTLPPEQFDAADPFRQTFDQMHETEQSTGTPVRPGCCLNYRIERYCRACPLPETN